MKTLLVLLTFALPLFSYAGDKGKVEQDRFHIWYANKEKISNYGFNKDWQARGNKLDKKLESEDEVLGYAEEAIKTRNDNISDIESGKESSGSLSMNYNFSATIYGDLFDSLSRWYYYKDRIYDTKAEKELAKNKGLAKEYPNCPLYTEYKERNDAESEFSRSGRIEHRFNKQSKMEFAREAKPYRYILEMERATWLLSQRASVKDNDTFAYDVSVMAIKEIDEKMKLIKENK